MVGLERADVHVVEGVRERVLPRNYESELQLPDDLFCPLVDEDREVRGRLLTTVDDVVAHRDDLLFPNV